MSPGRQRWTLIAACFSHRVVAGGALLAGLGMLDFVLLDADSPFLLAVPGYFLVGVGYGTAVPAISAVAMGAIEVERAGVAGQPRASRPAAG